MVPPTSDDAPPSTSHDAATVNVVQHCRHCGAPQPLASAFCSKCGATSRARSDAPDPLRDKLQALVGTELEIERELGRGGMAAVYAAFDTALQRRVAVKVLLPEIADDRGMADRFLREARTVASLQHPHVVTVYGVRSGEGVQAIIMQFVEGRSLDVILAERGRLPVHLAGMLLAQAAEGLQHAHDRGVVHRDVKPANVLIDREGSAVVSDFGIARRDFGPRTTGTGMVVGTWAYMSPEQRSAQEVTPATDQYAFGVMAFELLTGQLPFNGSAGEMLRAHMLDPVPSMRALRADVPAHVEAIVQRMMAKAPADRWPSLKEAERAFRKLVPDEGQTTLQMAALTVRTPGHSAPPAPSPATVATRTVAGSAATKSSPAVASVAPATASAGAARSRRSWVIATVVVLAALSALGAWAVKSRTSAPTVAQGSAAPAALPLETTPADESQGTPAASRSQAPAGSATAPAAASASGQATATTGAAAAAVPSGSITPSPLAGAGKSDAPEKPAAKAEEPPSPRREPEANAARVLPVAVLADARRLGREFVTLLNQRRAREVAQFTAMGGDAAVRAELLKRTESATDFAAGFDRVPGAPEEWTNGFVTEFHLDLQWRGGSAVMRIRLFASPVDGGWRTVGFAADLMTDDG